MLSASLYIIVCSARNRLRVRLRRLREPRYLIGALAGAAYLYFSIFARVWGHERAPRDVAGERCRWTWCCRRFRRGAPGSSAWRFW